MYGLSRTKEFDNSIAAGASLGSPDKLKVRRGHHVQVEARRPPHLPGIKSCPARPTSLRGIKRKLPGFYSLYVICIAYNHLGAYL